MGTKSEGILVEEIHLVRRGEKIVVRVSVCGQWIDVISEHYDGPISRYVTSTGILKAGTGMKLE